MKPTDLMRLMAQGNFHYILYFQDRAWRKRSWSVTFADH